MVSFLIAFCFFGCGEMAIGLKDVLLLILFQRSPIAASLKQLMCPKTSRVSFSSSKISPLCFRILIWSSRVIACFVYKKNGPPWYVAFLADEKRWRDLLGAKIQLLFQASKCFCEPVHSIYNFL